MSKKELTMAVFDGLPANIQVACVDYDGLLKFGDNADVRFTWASERWRGAEWLKEIEGTNFKPLTHLRRYPRVA
ncbi:MAG: hypothetical protein GY807_18915 [Gammaproteobacteria bacterium]|nr:hypothetical protein [Gammaproteobacteria bacterium]